MLYTDGLVESHESPIDVGMERLRTRIAAAPAAPADEVATRLLESLPGEPQDDIALLVLRLETRPPGRLELRLPARADALAPLRDRLGHWLEEVGVDAAEASAICLAAWEACVNAVEHPLERREEALEVAAELVGQEVVVRVRDHGRWRTPESRPDRGFGLRLIGGLMDAVEIVRGAEGTEVRMRRRVPAAAAG